MKLDVFLMLQVLQDVTKEEFINIMEILKSLTYMNTVQGRQQLLDIVTEQAELDQPFEVHKCMELRNARVFVEPACSELDCVRHSRHNGVFNEWMCHWKVSFG